jgi:intracellular sulfur oxidation DsrE/DsrF family protein
MSATRQTQEPRVPVDRRQFVVQGSTAVAALGVGLAGTPRGASAAAPLRGAAFAAAIAEEAAQASPQQGAAMTFDDSWLAKLDGKSSQVFDCPKHLNGGILIPIANWFGAMINSHGKAAADCVPILALHGTSIGVAMQDHLWEKFKLGEKLEVDDRVTSARSVRNPWYREADSASPSARIRVAALQERGLIVIICNNNLRGWSGMLARETNQTADATREELIAGLVPGTIVVPAAVAAIHRAQIAGAGYSYLTD